MKYCVTLWIVLVALSCGPAETPKDFFTATVSATDSLIFLDGVPIVPIEEALPKGGSWGINVLDDSLTQRHYAMEDSAKVSDVDHEGRLRLVVSADAPLMFVLNLFVTGRRAGFDDVRLVSDSIEIPIGPNYHNGLRHYVAIDSSGILLYTEFRIRPPAEGPPSDDRESVVRLGPMPRSRPLRIRGGLEQLKHELEWMTAELERIEFSGGRLFTILCGPGTRARDFMDVSSVIVESMPKKAAVNKAALFDVAFPPPPKPKGEFRYFNRYTASFDKFSITMGLAHSEVGDTVLDTTDRHNLLGLSCILYSAIEQDNEIRVARIGESGIRLNRHCFLEFNTGEEWNGYTPLLLAIHFDRPKLVAFLLNGGADVHQRSRKFKMRIPSLLGELSTSTDEWRGREISPMQLAKEKKNDTVIQLLRSAGAKE